MGSIKIIRAMGILLGVELISGISVGILNLREQPTITGATG